MSQSCQKFRLSLEGSTLLPTLILLKKNIEDIVESITLKRCLVSLELKWFISEAVPKNKPNKINLQLSLLIMITEDTLSGAEGWKTFPQTFRVLTATRVVGSEGVR